MSSRRSRSPISPRDARETPRSSILSLGGRKPSNWATVQQFFNTKEKIEDYKRGGKMQKKIETFFKEDKDSSKRFKALWTFLEGTSVREQQQFFSENAFAIYFVVRENIAILEMSVKNRLLKDKEASDETRKEIVDCLTVLSKMMQYVPDLIRQRWQEVSMSQILRKCTAAGNTADVRSEGLNILLTWLLTFEELKTPTLVINLFENMFDLNQFVPKEKANIIELRERRSSGVVEAPIVPLPKDTDLDTQQVTVDQLSLLLNYMGSSIEIFKRLWHLLKVKYLVDLYPEPCRENGLLASDSTNGFPLCPMRIELVMLEYVIKWLRGDSEVHAEIRSYLSQCPIDIMLVTEILRQGFYLPFDEADSIIMTVDLYGWMLENDDSFMFLKDEALFGDAPPYFVYGYQNYVRLFIDHASRIFFTDVTDHDTALATRVFLRVFSFYQTLSQSSKNSAEKITEYLLQTIMSITEQMLQGAERMTRQSKDIEATESYRADEFYLSVGKYVTRNLLSMWIRANVTTPLSRELWAGLLQLLSGMADRSSVIENWRACMLELTYMLGDIVYEVKLDKLPLNLSRSKSRRFRDEQTANINLNEPKNVKEDSKGLSNANMTMPILNMAVELHPQIVEVLEGEDLMRHYEETTNFQDSELEPEQIVYLWKNMLSIVGDMNEIKSPQIYAMAMDALEALWTNLYIIRANMGIGADGKAISMEHRKTPPLFYMSSWVFEACERDIAYLDGKYTAYRMLCRMMIRRLDHDVPSHYWSNFYRLLHQAFTSEDEKVLSIVFRHCQSIFSLLPPGFSVIVIDFLQAAEKVLSSDSRTFGLSVRKDALGILLTLITQHRTYEGRELVILDRMSGFGKMEASYVPYVVLRSRLWTILKKAVTEEPFEETRYMGFSGLTTLVFEEMSYNPTTQMVVDALNIFLGLLSFPDRNVASLAVSSIDLMRERKSNIIRVCPDIESRVIEGILQAIRPLASKAIGDGSNSPSRSIVVQLFACLLPWFMEARKDILQESDVAHLTFSTILSLLTMTTGQRASQLFDSDNRIDGGMGSSNLSPSPQPRRQRALTTDLEHVPSSTEGPGSAKLSRRGEMAMQSTSDADIASKAGNGDASSAMNAVQAAARNMLFTLVNHFGAFPDIAGITRLTSAISENDDATKETELSSAIFQCPGVQFFAYGDHLLLTLIEIPSTPRHPGLCRVIVRDVRGKYTWDLQLENEDIALPTSNPLDVNGGPYGMMGDTVEKGENGVVPYPGVVRDYQMKSGLSTSSGGPDDVNCPLLTDESGPGALGIKPGADVLDSARPIEDDLKDGLSQRASSQGGSRTLAPNCLNDSQTSASASTMIRGIGSQGLALGSMGQLAHSRRADYRSVHSLTSPRGDESDDIDGDNLAPQVDPSVLVLPRLDVRVPTADVLDELLQYIGNSAPENLPTDSRPLNCIAPAPESVVAIEDALCETIEDYALKSAYDQMIHAHKVINRLEPPPVCPIFDNFHYCRLFISHMGLLDWKNRQHFQLLKKNDNLIRRIKQLDKVSSRDYHKIGIVYVGRGQEDEASILGNTQGSVAYETFVSSLGWEIDLASHTGFMGGLSASGLNGKTTPYYATATMEVIFHVSTRMPQVDDDPKHFRKKKHIGNDRVTIIWNEHTRAYRPEVLKSRFNDVIFIITPLKNGTFLVEIERKPEVPVFGVLEHGTVVTMRCLGPLIRATAINANRAVMSLELGYQSYSEQRETYLKEILTNHKMHSSAEFFMGATLVPSIAVAN
eukprot:Clim_evm35s6 gene=Clim_evmTU35s6